MYACDLWADSSICVRLSINSICDKVAVACSQVVKAHLDGKSEVAIKFLQVHEESIASRADFFQEMDILCSCRHPGVVSMLGWGSSQVRR